MQAPDTQKHVPLWLGFQEQVQIYTGSDRTNTETPVKSERTALVCWGPKG